MKITKRRSCGAAEISSPASSSSPLVAVANGRPGRPSLDPVAPMSPNTLAGRRRKLGRESYKRKKLSNVRRNAVLMRLDRREGGDAADDVDDSSEEDADGHVGDDGCDDVVEGGEGRALHDKTRVRRRKEFASLLPEDLYLKTVILKQLAKDFDVEEIVIDTEKVFNTEGRFHRSTLHRYKTAATDFLKQMQQLKSFAPSKERDLTFSFFWQLLVCLLGISNLAPSKIRCWTIPIHLGPPPRRSRRTGRRGKRSTS